MTVSTEPAPALTGYEAVERFYVKRGRQGGRTVYTLDVTPVAIAQGFLAKPDPDKKVEGQRDLIPRHAQEFANYLIDNDEWVSPPLLLRAPDVFNFTPARDAVDVRQWGYLEILKMDRGELNVMDGHHRTLGFYLAYETLVTKRTKLRGLIAAAERNQEPTVEHYKTQLRRVEDKLRQLSTETVTLELHIVDHKPEFEQIFVDVNDNVVGVKKSLRANYDSRSVVHRALQDITGHVLLHGRVDEQQDSISRKSPYLLGLKHVADLTRTVKFGMRSRVTKNRERQLKEHELTVAAVPFFDALVGGFPDLKRVAEGELTPIELREHSLLGSATMIRALAGVWHDLTDSEGVYQWTPEQVTDFFNWVSRLMVSPLPDASPWLTGGLESNFYKGANGYTSPNAHRGVDVSLQQRLLLWALRWSENQSDDGIVAAVA